MRNRDAQKTQHQSPVSRSLFRLSETLLAKLQEEARRHNRSLNNLVESVLMAFVSGHPNKKALAAMKDAETSGNPETLDMKSSRNFVDSL